MALQIPKRKLNAVLFYMGCCGLIFQLTALVFGWFVHQTWLQLPWYGWLGPLICLMWALLPALQLQRETPQPYRQKF